MYLSNITCKNAQAKSKQYKLADGDGMYLLVTPSGSKLWRLKYRFGGKEKTAALGSYPAVSLLEAREKRQELRKQIAAGIDPAASRKESKLLQKIELAASFENVAREWHTNRSKDWSPRVAKQVLSVLQRNLFPALGPIPIKDVTSLMLLTPLREIESRDALDLLADARSYAGQIFRYAISTGRAERDVAADLRDAFRKHKSAHHACLMPDQLPKFLRALYGSNSGGMGILAVKLALLTLVRTTELRAAPWAEFDLDQARWTIPAERMKMRRPHIVPLSRQAVALLTEWHKETGHQKYVFPNTQRRKNPMMSENTMLKVLKELDYGDKTTIHGLRSIGSTILHESEKFSSLAIELQLAHVDKNNVRKAYNHAQYLPKRVEMMQWWADYLDEALAKKD